MALLLAAALAPTDPVLAAEVRVGEPTSGDDEEDEEEVRFTLTSEAGLNDGLAMPFVLAAVAWAAAAGEGWSAEWIGHWLLADVLLRAAVGLVAGVAVGRLLGRLFFRSRHVRLSQQMEGFTALGATFTAYGLTELLHGYGFLAVFVTACTIRAAERNHGYHQVLHGFSEQIERLLTAVLLFLLGGYLVATGLADLPWQGALLGLALILVIRPAMRRRRPAGLPGRAARAGGHGPVRHPGHRLAVLPRVRARRGPLRAVRRRAVGGGGVHGPGLRAAARCDGDAGDPSPGPAAGPGVLTYAHSVRVRPAPTRCAGTSPCGPGPPSPRAEGRPGWR